MAPADPTPGYAQALDELDAILRELEGSDVDVDRLADRVARATELIAVCRQRIGEARLRIDEVIADLDGERRDADGGAVASTRCPPAAPPTPGDDRRPRRRLPRRAADGERGALGRAFDADLAGPFDEIRPDGALGRQAPAPGVLPLGLRRRRRRSRRRARRATPARRSS